MGNFQQFLIVMTALSTASQTLTEHLIKKRWATKLDLPMNDLVEENKRQSKIHLYSGIIGALLAAFTGLRPLTLLLSDSDNAPTLLAPEFYINNVAWIECILVGVLVSYGGGFFNELLGVMREFKDAQAEVRKAVAAKAGDIAATSSGANSTPSVTEPGVDVVLPSPPAPVSLEGSKETEDNAALGDDTQTQPYPDSPGEQLDILPEAIEPEVIR